MDFNAAWGKTTDGAKTAYGAAADKTTDTLDSVAPVFVPFAARWDAEAARRMALRTPENLKALMEAQREHAKVAAKAARAKSDLKRAEAASNNPFDGARRAARTANRATRGEARAARRDLKAARKNYPQTLTRLAVKIHALHAVPAAIASCALSDVGGDWTVWPASTSVALIGMNAAGLWLGRRQATVPVADEELSAEERALMERLDPAYWVAHADERGLAGTVTGVPEITSGGIVCRVRLDGKWTVKTLRGSEDNVRNLLGMRTATRMRITNDRAGGWAVISIATRSAAAGIAAGWTPDRLPSDRLMMSLGLDTETGEEVLIPFDERMLVAGASGTGKSWSMRPLLATAHLRGDLVLIDGKGEEANEWDEVCRVAVELDEIDAVIDEIHAEMTRRKAVMKKRKISVWDGPQLTVFVDEGQVVLASVGKDKDRLQRLIELSSLGRSRGIVLWWATQKPTMSGGAPGVHNLIAPNLLTRFCLRVADLQEAQTALDDCADYMPHKIERGKEWRGHGYLKDYGPRMVRTWTLDNEGVRALPRKIWQGPRAQQERTAEDAPPLVLLKSEDAYAPDATAAETLTDNQRAVLKAVKAGAATNAEIAKATGINPGSVARAIDALVKRDLLAKNGTTIALGGAA